MHDTGKIVRTEPGKEDHGIMMLMLHIEGDGWENEIPIEHLWYKW